MRALHAIPWLALFLAAAFSLLVESGLWIQPVPPDLALLPPRLGSIELLEELPVAPDALGERPPERFSYRRIRDAAGHEGKLFIAYYRRAQRWSGRPHDVDRCFAAQGWEQRAATRLDAERGSWSRRFERAGESIRVVHWLERPGPDGDDLAWQTLVARLASSRGFRPDVASIYFEFREDARPTDAEFEAGVSALSRALEKLW